MMFVIPHIFIILSLLLGALFKSTFRSESQIAYAFALFHTRDSKSEQSSVLLVVNSKRPN